jgi:hypothetical protein
MADDSGTGQRSSGFPEFDRLLALVAHTRELLDAVVGGGELPDGGADFLTEETLPHLEGVQSGFQGWLRSESASAGELRYLLDQVAAIRVDPARTEAERRAAAAEALVEGLVARRAGRRISPIRLAEPWNLAALAHARVVLAFLPKLPAEAVRFGAGRRSYADIPIPRGPAELWTRIAELEHQLWLAVTGRPAPATDPAFRRTYGFFDAADQLGLRAFGFAA